jgi:hypothetical protein
VTGNVIGMTAKASAIELSCYRLQKAVMQSMQESNWNLGDPSDNLNWTIPTEVGGPMREPPRGESDDEFLHLICDRFCGN